MIDFDEMAAAYQQQEQERRRLFFEAMGIPDDGRLSPVMTMNDMKLNTPFNIFCHRFKM